MDNEKVGKEVLTKELIVKELKHMEKERIKVMLTNDAAAVVLFLAVSALLFGLTKSPLFFLLILLPIACTVVTLLIKIKKIKSLSVDDISVYTDTFSSIEKLHHRRYHNPEVFIFHGCTWKIYELRFYEWSKNYRMSLDGLKNTSVFGDTFYAVTMNDSTKAAVAYNTKFFTYAE